MATELTKGQIKPLADAIQYKPPFFGGTLKIPTESFTLFYGQVDNAQRIDLFNPTEERPVGCARKMDSSNFQCAFDAERLGLVGIACGNLIFGKAELKTVKAELYKLNVYGPGSFFKPHKDTPRDKTMFGSLVVTFPTTHEGGELVLRHKGNEKVMDFAAWLKEEDEPCVAYAAFFSDVEHEVLEVKSGYRVTITYNLYFEDAPATAPDSSSPFPVRALIPPSEQRFEEALAKLLNDPTFLPDGGTLGFGFEHQYPITIPHPEFPKKAPKNQLKPFLRVLKGNDAMVLQMFRRQGLDPFVAAIYEVDHFQFMCDKIIDLGEMYEESEVDKVRDCGGIIINCRPNNDWQLEVEEPVAWIKMPTDHNRQGFPYLAYGNEAQLEYLYGDLCLIVRVEPFGVRAQPAVKHEG
ncbi:hypothetical protein EW146_g1681 [Bondarzewia mesenterica]|uniref:Fe2OG dioxygenase domain-containing protein n=1 Tax=Bondarzewia mesenterica TaxID=1095465 RepID=A0A4S4M358_9AGAM|nr:hypothetical protein EW146_g1681 [Bondarzewia mesenterica]